MRISRGLIFLGLLCCNKVEAPQSQPTEATVKAQAEKPAEKIFIPIQAEPSPVANPVALEDLQARWPALEQLEPMRARVAGAAMNLAPGPCASCNDESLARCSLNAPEDCSVLDLLIERAAKQATDPSATVKMVEANLNYPDHWFDLSGAGGVLLGNKEAPTRVDLFLDATGLFGFETSGSLAKIRTSHPEDVRVYLHPADTAVGDAIWALGNEPQIEKFVADLFESSVPGKSKEWKPVDLGRLVTAATGHEQLPSGPQVNVDKLQDQALAKRVGVSNRPVWFVGGHRLAGAQSAEALLKMIQRERSPGTP